MVTVSGLVKMLYVESACWMAASIAAALDRLVIDWENVGTTVNARAERVPAPATSAVAATAGASQFVRAYRQPRFFRGMPSSLVFFLAKLFAICTTSAIAGMNGTPELMRDCGVLSCIDIMMEHRNGSAYRPGPG